MKRLLYILLVLNASLGYGQTEPAKLRDQLKNASLAKRAEIYIELGKYYRDNNPDSSRFYAGELLKIAKKNLSWQGEAYSIYSAVNRNQGKIQDALREAKQAVEAFRSANDSAGLSAAYSNLGTCYYFASDFKQSLEYQFKALPIKEALGQKKGVASILLNIGNVYLQQQNFDKAKEIYNKALVIFEEIGMLQGISTIRNNLGIIAETTGKYEEALTQYLMGKAIEEQSGDLFGLSGSYYNIAEVYFKTNRYSLAKENYRLAYETANKVDNIKITANALSQIALIELQEGNLASADFNSRKAYNMAQNNGFGIAAIPVIRSRMRVLAAKKNYAEAYRLSQQLAETEESKNAQEREQELRDIQASYQVDLDKQKLQLMQKDRDLQDISLRRQKLLNKVYTGAIAVALLLLFFIVNRYFLILKNEKALQKMNISLEEKVHDRTRALQDALEKAKTSDRLKTFFLSNLNQELKMPINGIIGTARYLKDHLSESEKQQMAENLLNSSQRLSETLSDIIEISQIESVGENYASDSVNILPVIDEKVNALRSQVVKKGLDLHFQSFSEVLPVRADPKLVGRILDKLLHNAIKFTETGEIRVDVVRHTLYDKAYAEISVTDTGIGIAPEELEQIFEAFKKGEEVLYRGYDGLGIGLTLARKYAQLMSGELSAESALGKGSTFTLRIPLQEV